MFLMAAIFTAIGSGVTFITDTVTSVLATIVATPILLIPVLFAVVGGVIAVASKLFKTARKAG
jgi:prepilin signal peptidase PulO-like enzyme (type II secretory pathway)